MALVLPFLYAPSGRAAVPLTTLEFRVVGTELKVSPAVLSVPKGIAGSIAVELIGSSGTNGSVSITNTYVEATLRGPGMDARRLVAAVNTPLLLPSLNLVGDYQLDGIRLVDTATGEVKLEGSPSAVPVHVFDEVLISRVTSRPLTAAEIKEKGIAIDENNFRAVEFEVVVSSSVTSAAPSRWPPAMPPESFETTRELQVAATVASGARSV